VKLHSGEVFDLTQALARSAAEFAVAARRYPLGRKRPFYLAQQKLALANRVLKNGRRSPMGWVLVESEAGFEAQIGQTPWHPPVAQAREADT
jgi:hypothetical protein